MTPSDETKRRTHCGKTKPLSGFYRHSNKKGVYYRGRCKPCHSRQATAYASQPIVRELKRVRERDNYYRNQAQRQAYQRAYYRFRKSD